MREEHLGILAVALQTQQRDMVAPTVSVSMATLPQSPAASTEVVEGVLRAVLRWYPHTLSQTVPLRQLMQHVCVDVPLTVVCPHCRCALRQGEWKESRALTLDRGLVPIRWRKSSCDVCLRDYSNCWEFEPQGGRGPSVKTFLATKHLVVIVLIIAKALATIKNIIQRKIRNISEKTDSKTSK